MRIILRNVPKDGGPVSRPTLLSPFLEEALPIGARKRKYLPSMKVGSFNISLKKYRVSASPWAVENERAHSSCCKGTGQMSPGPSLFSSSPRSVSKVTGALPSRVTRRADTLTLLAQNTGQEEHS